MELFFERRFYTLKEIKIDNFSCKYCNRKTSLNIAVCGGVVSFLIPVAPIKKDYVLTCENCQKRIYEKDLDYTAQEKLINEFKSTKYKVPIWHFSGIAILMTLLIFAIFTGIEMQKQEKLFISKPLKNDVYFIKNDMGWTTFKVLKVKDDSLYGFKNSLILNDYSKVKDIDIEDNYTEIIGFRLNEIQKMYNSNEIYEVKR